MARPRHENPTPGELEVLQVIWDRGPCTVRQVMSVLNQTRRRAYTSIMSLMNIMDEKGLLKREPKGRAFVYKNRATRKKTLSKMVADLLGRAFDGSASEMVAHLLEQTKPSKDELKEINKTISTYRQKRGG